MVCPAGFNSQFDLQLERFILKISLIFSILLCYLIEWIHHLFSPNFVLLNWKHNLGYHFQLFYFFSSSKDHFSMKMLLQKNEIKEDLSFHTLIFIYLLFAWFSYFHLWNQKQPILAQFEFNCQSGQDDHYFHNPK